MSKYNNDSGLFDDLIDAVVDIFKPKMKGYMGEFINQIAFQFLEKEEYKIINNIILVSNGKTTQIDHVLVSNYGIFVIEVKNYSGMILGNDFDMFWTQVLYKRKEKFYSPVRQNYAHMKALQELLKEFNNVQYYPIVVFDSEVELKVKSSSIVIYQDELLSIIKQNNTKCINDKVRDKIYEKLRLYKNENEKLKFKHIKDIKHQKENIRAKVENDICPNCSGKLVLRSGKYGSFKGCSNYPKCRFTWNS